MKKNIRKMVVSAMLSAIAVILMHLEFPLSFLPPYLKFDLGELPALIGSFALGPWWGVLICLAKNLLCVYKTATAGVGELANFLVGASFVLTAGLIYQKHKTKKSAIIAALLGTVAMTIVSFPINYFITYPFYMKAMLPYEAIVGMYSAICPFADNLIKGLLIFNLPFTFAKGIIISIITILVYKKLSPILKGR